MTVDEIYQVFAQNILDNVPGDYVQAYSRFERQQGEAPTGGGYYIRPNGQVDFYTYPNAKNQDRQVIKAVEELWQMTHATGHYDWTVLYFQLRPGGRFDIEFALEEKPPHPSYRDRVLRFFAPQHSSLATTQLMARLLARVPVLATELSRSIAARLSLTQTPWEEAQLQLTKSTGGQFQIRARAAQLQLVPANDRQVWTNVAVQADYGVFRSLVELSTISGLGNWSQASVRVFLNGCYILTFDSDPASGQVSSHGGNLLPAGRLPLQQQGRWRD